MLLRSLRLPTWAPLWVTALFLAGAPAHGATAVGGEGHSAVALPDGTLWVWGANDRGQLGNGMTVPSLTPVQVSGLANIVAVASGDAHLLALTSAGDVWAWGANDSGQVGDGTNDDCLFPVVVLSGVAGIDAGPDFSIAWKADGSLWTWGANGTGQLGDGTLLPSNAPASISGLTGVVQASAGNGHALALTTGGSLWSWGLNASGQLGDGTRQDQLSPVAVTAIIDAIALVAGPGASYAIRGNGRLWAWGGNADGQLGARPATHQLGAVSVGVPMVVQAVRAGGGHVLSQVSDGIVWSWGRNNAGQVGDGTIITRLMPAPLALAEITEIGAGLEHSLAITRDGVVWTWGRNTHGQLGDGTIEDRKEPVAISGPGFRWKVGRPVLEPPGGRYEEVQDVTISSATSGAWIRYTADGDDPNQTSQSLPSGGTVAIGETATLKAQAVKEGRTPSDVVTGVYTLKSPTALDDQVLHPPSARPRGGKSTLPDSGDLVAIQSILVTPEPVLWTATAGVTVDGSSLTKITATDWGNSGAVSHQQIVSGDGYVEFTATEANTDRILGLSNGNSDNSYTDIDFGLNVRSDGLITIWEAGTFPVVWSGYIAGDTLRVEVAGGVVSYSRNGVVFYTSVRTPVYPLLVDSALYQTGATLTDVVIGGNWSLPPPRRDVIWTEAAGVSIDGNDLTKTAATDWGNAGAVSLQRIESGNGYVEFTVTEANTRRIIGLSNGNPNNSYYGTDFGVLLRQDGLGVYIWEGVDFGGAFGPAYAPGDKYRVEVIDGVVSYSRNGVVFYTSSQTPVYPLLVDAALYESGSTLTDVVVGGDWSFPPSPEEVIWKESAGVSIDGNDLTKTAATDWGNAGAVSLQQIESGNAYVEFTVAEANTSRIIGLSSENSNNWYYGTDFGVLLRQDGLGVYIWEGVDFGGAFGPAYAPGDKYRVEVIDGVVSYSRNGVVFYTSSQTPVYPLLVDAALYENGATLTDVVVGGAQVSAGKVATPVISPPGGLYYEAQTVSVTCGTANAIARYTLDSTEPDDQSQLVPETGIPIDASATLRVKAWKDGFLPSDTAIEAYEFKVATPSFDPAGGTYTTAQTVAITTSTADAAIHYTTDGITTPTTSSPLYTTPLPITATTLLKAAAFKTGWTGSDVGTATYTLEPPQENEAPVVDAGPDQTVQLPDGAVLDGTVTDDGLPSPPTLTTTWSQTSGPGTVTFADPSAVDTTATFSEAGTYVLRLTADDGALQGWAELTVTVQENPAQVQGAISAGYSNSFALTSAGEVWGWGHEGLVGETGGDHGLGPTRVSALADIARVSAGWGHTLVVTSDGLVWAWGDNRDGQLGLGDTSYREVPTLVPGLTDVVAVAAGEYHSLALLSDGTVKAWGYNGYGQLGLGDFTNRHVPVPVPGLTDVVAVATGERAHHSLALLSDGTVRGWGYNYFGQVGDGTVGAEHQYKASPQEVLTPANVDIVGISAGLVHSLAVDADGTVYAWGDNSRGQLGRTDLPDTNSPIPVDLQTPAGVAAVWGGDWHSLAVGADGTAYTWGGNHHGQLGDGTTTDRATPAPVPSLPPVTALAGGYDYSLALAADGRIWGWGSNNFRQVGDWTTVDKWSPVQISEPGFAWKASTPTFTPPGDTYFEGQTVNVVSATPSAAVYYTSDGTEPNQESETVVPIEVHETLTLKARAFRMDLAPSSVGTADYVLQVPPPELSPSGGTHHHFVEVMVTSAVGSVTLHYTLDGTEPTESDPEVVSGGTVYVGESGRLSVKGWRPGWDPSAVAAADYAITAPRPLDSDGDGLSDADEAMLGSDPQNPDTNGDGLPDGAAYAAGLSVIDTDMDADGLANLDEATAGTDPFDPDSDADAVPDGADCYPLDPARSACLPLDPSDGTPPNITLAEPTNAVLVSTTP